MLTFLIGLLIGACVQFTAASRPFGLAGPEGTVIFLNGFHFVSGNHSIEISADHYCTIISNDFLQCVVYSTDTKPAKLAAIEYIVSPTLFEKLDEQERLLWHSHSYELPLITPSWKSLVGTYGKTFQTWTAASGDSPVPLGIPQLLMGYTGDSQITPDFVTSRDKLFGVNTTAIRASREDIAAPKVIQGADSWKMGIIPQLSLVNLTSATNK